MSPRIVSASKGCYVIVNGQRVELPATVAESDTVHLGIEHVGTGAFPSPGVIVTDSTITPKQARRLKRHFLSLRWWQRRIGRLRL